MDIGNIAGVSSALAQEMTRETVGILMLKKSLDIEAQTALQLLQALPQPAANNPPNLGNSIDTFA